MHILNHELRGLKTFKFILLQFTVYAQFNFKNI